MRFYIDPGTGSMLFTILIGVLGAAVYALRNSFMKLRFFLTGGRGKTGEQKRLPFVIFTDSKRYWNVFGPICDEFERRGQELHYMTASPDDPALERQYDHVSCEFIGEGNRAFAKLNMLKADVLLSSTPGLDVYQWKRSPDVKRYVHIPHAISDITIYHMFGVDYYDALLLSGDYQVKQIRQLEQLRALPPKDCPIVGQPYMDALKKRLEQAAPLPEHPTTVLLAPSWGNSSVFSHYGGRIIEALLQTGYHIIIRPHPQSFSSEKEMIESLMRDFPESEQLEWNRDNDNFDALRRSDLLLSDFSGVIFDFALVFDRPVIYADTAFDKTPYDASWLDEELWVFTTLPKIGRQLRKEDLGDLKSLIDACLADPSYSKNRETARQETWAHIGQAAELTVDYLIRTYEQLQEGEASPQSSEAATT